MCQILTFADKIAPSVKDKAKIDIMSPEIDF